MVDRKKVWMSWPGVVLMIPEFFVINWGSALSVHLRPSYSLSNRACLFSLWAYSVSLLLIISSSQMSSPICGSFSSKIFLDFHKNTVLVSLSSFFFWYKEKYVFSGIEFLQPRRTKNFSYSLLPIQSFICTYMCTFLSAVLFSLLYEFHVCHGRYRGILNVAVKRHQAVSPSVYTYERVGILKKP